ncbi:hypothetical protein EDC01DRAFT_752117 [Geopyxis carbonaria]|nr:hypothetical protein EDC01DRAFT_752117 [Geopyxis carbonaria]
MSEQLPIELTWISFPTQTPHPLLPAQNQRVAIHIDHANGGLQLRSTSGALVGWVDPLDDARAMRVLGALGKGALVGGVITSITVGWPGAGPRLYPAEGGMVMRLLAGVEGEKAAAKAKGKALAKGRMTVKAGTAVKATKGVKGGRVIKRSKTKPKHKPTVGVAGVAKEMEGKTIPAAPGCSEEK